jgi:hypothetical protein
MASVVLQRGGFMSVEPAAELVLPADWLVGGLPLR